MNTRKENVSVASLGFLSPEVKEEDRDEALLKFTPGLQKKVKDAKERPEICAASERLAAAMNANPPDLTNPILSEDNTEIYAILAYQNKKITYHQCISAVLIQNAHKGFEDKLDCTVHQLNPENHQAKELFMGFIQDLYTPPGTPLGGETIEISPDARQKIMRDLLDPKIPESERCFMIFELNDIQSIPEIMLRLKTVGFHLFMHSSDSWTPKCIIFSFTQLEAVLHNISASPVGPNCIVPVFGNMRGDYISRLHESGQVPFGLSSPNDVMHLTADGFKAGSYGFALHDIFHMLRYLLLTKNAQNISRYLAQEVTANLPALCQSGTTFKKVLINPLIEGEFYIEQSPNNDSELAMQIMVCLLVHCINEDFKLNKNDIKTLFSFWFAIIIPAPLILNESILRMMRLW